MKKIIEGSFAVAEAVKLCKPKVIAAYPITPSTHIPERLSEFVANGEMDAEFIEVESEFSALSACMGASATGVRTFTATSSQGLALMHELLFATAGMRLPVVIAVVNRSLSAPLNIFNDQQDSVSQRDSGWIQLYVESAQEAADSVIQAFRIAEDANVLLPVLVCLDGFYISHTHEVADVPGSAQGFLPDYAAKHAYLDPQRPITQGAWALQQEYFDLRMELSKVVDSSLDTIRKVHDDFAQKFGRKYGDGLIEKYGDSSTVVVSMGSVCGNLKEVADKMGFEVLRVRCFRPFPKERIHEELKGKDLVVVLEKNIALGLGSGALFSEIRDTLYGAAKPKVVNFIGGLGGKDITIRDIESMMVTASSMDNGDVKWLK
jgi:pyruvate ferredoxin oxidoreductase alpha subunit